MEFVDLKKQYKSIKKEIDKAVRKVFNSSVFVSGKEVEDFENELADYCGVKHAIGVNSGTDALYLSLWALGIQKGDEVITSPFTFFATAEVIANIGAKPVFADINPKTFNIDAKEIERKITKKTKAIMPVHIFGQMADMASIMKIAKKYNLFVVEDAAQAIGAKWKMINGERKMAGSLGDFGCFSFFPAKNLGACGDGGMIATNNDELAEKIKLLRNHGSSPKEKYFNIVLGSNSRLDTIQAAILRVKLKYIDKWNRKRAENAEYYSRLLKEIPSVKIPFCDFFATHIFHQYTIGVNNRNELREFLKNRGIPSMVYYPIPLHLQPAFKYLGYKPGDLPEAEKAAKEVLSLPIYPELKKGEQDLIIKIIRNFLK